jgi:hypothetical protein
MLAGEHQQRGDLQVRCVQAQGWCLEHRSHGSRRGLLSCVFDSGTASDGTLNMKLHCSDPEEKQPSLYGAQLKLRPGKKIELIIEPMDQR